MTHRFLDKQGLIYLWQKILNRLNSIADDRSIENSNQHIQLKGYVNASQGQMLVKDLADGVAWINPVDDSSLQNAVRQAESSASNAGNSAVTAGNYAIDADNSAKTAERINQVTMQFVNDKFWWGSIQEYNALESLDEGTFYFVQM